MQGDAAIAIGGARPEGVGKLARQFVGGIEAAFGLPEDIEGNRRWPLLFEQALMRRGVVEFEKALRRLLELEGRACERKLVVIHAPLDVKVGLDQVHIALALGAHDGDVVNL
jgi:hypothetical protein